MEETLWEREQAAKALPTDLIAVFNDGFGNIYCVQTATKSSHESVYAWWHEDESGPELVAESFQAWLCTLPPAAD